MQCVAKQNQHKQIDNHEDNSRQNPHSGQALNRIAHSYAVSKRPEITCIPTMTSICLLLKIFSRIKFLKLDEILLPQLK